MVKIIDARKMGPEELVAQLRRPGGFLSRRGPRRSAPHREDVRVRGDEAFAEYTERFDGVRPERFRVPGKEIERARASLPSELEESFLAAFENVRAFHEREMDRSWEMEPRRRDGGTAGAAVPEGWPLRTGRTRSLPEHAR